MRAIVLEREDRNRVLLIEWEKRSCDNGEYVKNEKCLQFKKEQDRMTLRKL